MEEHKCSSTIDHHTHALHQQQQQQQQQDDDDQDMDLEGLEELKRTISCHPLYTLLLKTHLDCLKAGLGDHVTHVAGEKIPAENENNPTNVSIQGRTELDCFMETYCLALSKLNEELQVSQKESMAFINDMHSQLSELTKPTPSQPSTMPSDE